MCYTASTFMGKKLHKMKIPKEDNEMEILNFIKEHGDNWREIIRQKPYAIKVTTDGEYTILKYDQINSDLSLPLVKECRGLILDNQNRPVCVPFFKFFNSFEPNADNIDWNSARVQEKLDGSIIKLAYFGGEWRVSTNGTIDAYKSKIYEDLSDIECPYTTYGELWDIAKKKTNLDYDKLDKNCTYMFELVGPYNKVVVDYKETKIYHIGTRDNTTLQELDIDIGVEKPKVYPLSTLQGCLDACKDMPFNQEGYVVVDKDWHRVKIKSPAYVAVHRLKNNGDINERAVIELIRENELDEFLSYFPEFKKVIYEYKSILEKMVEDLTTNIKEISKKTYETQKDFALEVKDKFNSGFYFMWKKDNTLTPEAWLWNHDNTKLKEMIERWKNQN